MNQLRSDLAQGATNIWVRDVVTRLLCFKTQKATSVICHQEVWKRCINISIWIICCEGLTDWIAFVVKCKETKPTWIIMRALQFSTMYTIIHAFSGIRSKVVLECDKYSCKWYLWSLRGSSDIDINIVNAFSIINIFDVRINCQSAWNPSISTVKVVQCIINYCFLATALCNMTVNSIIDCE